MGIFGQILLGLVLVAVGVITIVKNYQVANTFPLHWLEQKIGPGSSYTIWKILSVLLVFAGLTTMFGFADEVLTWFLSPLTNLINPGLKDEL